MKYLSVDTETTGLHPDRAQILEFACVLDDGTKPVEELPTFRKLLKYEIYVGDAFALAMNHLILKEINDGGPDVIPGTELCEHLAQWLNNQGIKLDQKIVAAGKNFAGFDRPFLRKLPGFDTPGGINFHYRTLDPMMLYWEPEDEVPPSTEECCKRAGLKPEALHTAVADARDVARLIRRGVRRRSLSVVSNEELAA